MAIKIDLLPGYVKLRRDLNRSIAGCVVATGVVLGGLLLVLQQRRLDLQTAKENLAVMTDVATKATTAASDATKFASDSAPYEGAITFMTAASRTGAQRAAVIDMVRRAIMQNAPVSSIDISDGINVNIKATVKDTPSYAGFLLNLRRASDVNGGFLFAGLPTASGPGGFANGAVRFVKPEAPDGQPVPIVYPIVVTATGKLKNPVMIPTDPTLGTAAAPAAGTTPGISGTP